MNLPENRPKLAGMKPVTAPIIESLILKAMPDAQIKVGDIRGDGLHFMVHVACPAFANLDRLDQHRAVYAALASIINEKSLSLTLQTSDVCP